jgi:hypothetical protein
VKAENTRPVKMRFTQKPKTSDTWIWDSRESRFQRRHERVRHVIGLLDMYRVHSTRTSIVTDRLIYGKHTSIKKANHVILFWTHEQELTILVNDLIFATFSWKLCSKSRIFDTWCPRERVKSTFDWHTNKSVTWKAFVASTTFLE